MMRLSTLWSVDRLTRPDGSNPVAEQIVERWRHDAGSIRFYRSSANFLYRLRRGRDVDFLRFAASSERTRETIEAEVSLLRQLAGAALRVTTPVESEDGNAV